MASWNKSSGWRDVVTNCLESWTESKLIKFPKRVSQIPLQKTSRTMIQKCSWLYSISSKYLLRLLFQFFCPSKLYHFSPQLKLLPFKWKWKAVDQELLDIITAFIPYIMSSFSLGLPLSPSPLPINKKQTKQNNKNPQKTNKKPNQKPQTKTKQNPKPKQKQIHNCILAFFQELLQAEN